MNFKHTILWVAACFILKPAAHANSPFQGNNFEKYTIGKINILSPAIGSISFQIERGTSMNHSIVYSGFLFLPQTNNIKTDLRAIGLGLEYRLYLEESNEQGIYLQPFFRYKQLFDTKDDFSLGIINPGLLLGYQIKVLKYLYIDTFLGPQYSLADNSTTERQQVIDEAGIFVTGYSFRGGILLGFKF